MSCAFQPFLVLQHKPDLTLGWIASYEEKPFSKVFSKFTTPRYSLMIFEPFELASGNLRGAGGCKTTLLEDITENELELNWTQDLVLPKDIYRPASFDEGIQKCSKGNLVDFKEALPIRNRFLEMPYVYWRHSNKSGFCEDQAESLAVLSLEVAELYNQEYPRRAQPVDGFDYARMEALCA